MKFYLSTPVLLAVALAGCTNSADLPIVVSADVCGLNSPLPGAQLKLDDDFAPWGWAFDRASGSVPKNVSIHLVSDDLKSSVVIPMKRTSRPDVSKAFGKPELEQSGFAAKTKLSGLSNGTYAVSVVQVSDKFVFVCPAGKVSVSNL